MAQDITYPSRRRFLSVAGVSTAAALLGTQKLVAHDHAESMISTEALHPNRSSLALNKIDTAVVFIDPQNDVLSESGRAWAAVSESVKENKTIGNMERIFKTAKSSGFEVFISPHYFFPEDRGWKFNGPLETDEVKSNLFGRTGRLRLDGLQG